MVTKVCSRCKQEKDAICFSKDKRHSDGLYSACKDCVNSSNREARLKWSPGKRAQVNKNKREYQKKHPDKKKQWDVIYQKKHTIKILQNKRDYYFKNKERIIQYKKDYAQKNKDKIARYKRERYLNNIDREKDRVRVYYNNNKERYRVRQKERSTSQPQYRIAHNLRTRIGAVLAGRSKGGSLNCLIGCNMDFLKGWFELYFTDGMSWDNYGRGGWHIDHIKPCICFDLTKTEEQKKCFHYTNLQPMWETENISKNSKYNGVLYRKNNRS
jgi:hypothetical protein